MTARPQPGARRASVLILALWVLFFLAALTVAIASRVGTGITVAQKVKTAAEARLLAEAGRERVLFEMGSHTGGWDSAVGCWSGDAEATCRDVALGAGSFSVWSVYDLPGGGLQTNAGVIGEEGRVNLNKADRPMLKALVAIAGDTDPVTADGIAAAIIDWRDADDDLLTGGAEREYYAALTPSYTCANSEFRSVYELALVKGVDRELFERLRPSVTVVGRGRVDINSAGAVALESAAAAAGENDEAAVESVVSKILAFRRDGHVFEKRTRSEIFEKLETFAGLRPEERMVLTAMMPRITTVSSHFRGVAEGTAGGEGVGASTRRFDFVFKGGTVKREPDIDRVTRPELVMWQER